MALVIDGAGGLTFNDGTKLQSAPSGFSFKNRIINGAMMIDQRNAGAVYTGVGYSIDRWANNQSITGKFTVQQNAGSVTPPAGFINYLGAVSTSAYTAGSTEEYIVYQPIEGLNMADLGWGTANAKTVTLSFWVYSSLTGTFGGSFRNSAVNRSCPFSYTISSANTWEQKSVTITGDTSGTWLTTNGVGTYISFSLGAGSTRVGTAGTWVAANYVSVTGATSVVGTNGATFYITGVQLEVGSQATSFDFRDYGRELVMCQRYYEILNSGSISMDNGSTDSIRNFLPFRVVKRAAPSISTGGGGSESGGTWTPSFGSTLYGTTCAVGISTLIRPYINGPITASIEL